MSGEAAEVTIEHGDFSIYCKDDDTEFEAQSLMVHCKCGWERSLPSSGQRHIYTVSADMVWPLVFGHLKGGIDEYVDRRDVEQPVGGTGGSDEEDDAGPTA